MQQLKVITINKWVIAAILAVLVFGIGGGLLLYSVNTNTGETVVISVAPGMSTQQIGDLLYKNGLITSPRMFAIEAKIVGLENSLQAGQYTLTKDMSVRQIVDKLAKGEVSYRLITIPEGYTVNQIANLVEAKKLGKADKFKALARDYAPYDYITAKSEAAYKVEGFVFPDTYKIAAGATEEQILRIMVEQFNRQFTPAMKKRINEMGLSIPEVITLASLVERETRLENERPVIAGVFFNRLKVGMPLQSCATIQYILGTPKPELTVKDTEIPSPYNTYQNPGLPPGPIASPGIASIKAVLYPAETEYLYFVADSKGAHHFSRTYEEHLNAIEQVSR